MSELALQPGNFTGTLKTVWFEKDYVAKSSGNTIPKIDLSFEVEGEEKKIYRTFYFSDKSTEYALRDLQELTGKNDLEDWFYTQGKENPECVESLSSKLKTLEGREVKIQLAHKEYKDNIYYDVKRIKTTTNTNINWASTEPQDTNNSGVKNHAPKKEVPKFNASEEVPF